MCIATEDSYYILSFDAEQVQKARDNNEVADDGVEAAFEVLGEVIFKICLKTFISLSALF